MADGDILTEDSTQTGGSGVIKGKEKYAWKTPAAAPTMPAVWWSSPEMAALGLYGFTPTRQAASQTCGVAFHVLNHAMTCTGAKFYWKRGSADRTVRLKLWEITHADGFSSGTELANVDVNVTADGVYSGAWTGVALTANKKYLVSMWETSGTDYTRVAAVGGDAAKGVPSWPFPMGPFLLMSRTDRYTAGNNFPLSGGGSELFPIVPVISALAL
jgi:hypothetical protein